MSLLAACGNTPTTPPQSNHPAIWVHTPPPHTNSALVGTYTTTITKQDGIALLSLPAVTFKDDAGTLGLGLWIIQFRNDGYFTAESSYNNGPDVYVGFGQYVVTGNTLTVSDAKCWEFDGPRGQTAMYMWLLQGQKLILQVVGQDLCGTRKGLFTSHPLIRQS